MVTKSMIGKTGKNQVIGITQEDINEKKNTLRHRPHPPKYYGNPSHSQSLGRYCVNHEHDRKQKAVSNIDESLFSCIKQLNEKEKKYILQLKILKEKLERVCSSHCGKVLPIKNILDFHINTLSLQLIKSSNVLDIPKIFISCKSKFQMYSDFARNKNDFSYIVVDLCENVVDLLKARLLEYNFTLSQINTICSDNGEIKTACKEAEDVIKEVYHQINHILITQRSQQ